MVNVHRTFRIDLRIIFTSILAGSFSICTHAQSMILALSKADHTLALVDAVSLKVIAKVPVGQDPHEVVASGDGSTAYVSIYGGGAFHEIDIIDLNKKKLLLAYDTSPLFGPHGLDFQNGQLWFTAEGSKSIGRFDPATNKTAWIMGTGQDRTHMIAATDAGKRIYTTNVSSGTVSILTDTLFAGRRPGDRPHEDWQQTVIPVGKGSEGFDVSPNGKELWTAASEDGMIYIIDCSSKQLEAKIDAHAMGANRLKFTTDGKYVLITSLQSGDLIIYDASKRRESKRIAIGHGAAGILMDPAGTRAFVACTPDDYIAIIDLKSFTVTGHLTTGGGPDGLAWASKK